MRRGGGPPRGGAGGRSAISLSVPCAASARDRHGSPDACGAPRDDGDPGRQVEDPALEIARADPPARPFRLDHVEPVDDGAADARAAADERVVHDHGVLDDGAAFHDDAVPEGRTPPGAAGDAPAYA